MTKKSVKIKDLCMIGVVTAVTCLISPIAFPIPMGVPITMQTFAIMLAGIILGAKRGAISTLIYILIGSIGIPVFSNFTGGYQCLVGPNGGFILSFPLMAYIIGLGCERRTNKKCFLTLGLIIGTVTNFCCGILLFCYITQSSFLVGFTTCVLPFIPGEILKIFLASMLGLHIKKRIF